jgi:hypothetical protein
MPTTPWPEDAETQLDAALRGYRAVSSCLWWLEFVERPEVLLARADAALERARQHLATAPLALQQKLELAATERGRAFERGKQLALRFGFVWEGAATLRAIHDFVAQERAAQKILPPGRSTRLVVAAFGGLVMVSAFVVQAAAQPYSYLWGEVAFWFTAFIGGGLIGYARAKVPPRPRRQTGPTFVLEAERDGDFEPAPGGQRRAQVADAPGPQDGGPG